MKMLKPRRLKQSNAREYAEWVERIKSDEAELVRAASAVSNALAKTSSSNNVVALNPIAERVAKKGVGGRPASAVVNDLAPLVQSVFDGMNVDILSSYKGVRINRFGWFYDVCYGAMNIDGVGKSNSGEFKIRFSHLNRALVLPELSTRIVEAQCKVKERTAQWVMKAARTALGGIRLYLERHPDMVVTLTETSSNMAPAQLPNTVRVEPIYTAEQLELRSQGRYVEYGESVRAMRLAQMAETGHQVMPLAA